ncbi:hypothetical protein P4O66_022051, partial [Electrophorus voltai]
GFQQLEEDNQVICEHDLSKCATEDREVSEFSGVYSQIVKQDLHWKKVYPFWHVGEEDSAILASTLRLNPSYERELSEQRLGSEAALCSTGGSTLQAGDTS